MNQIVTTEFSSGILARLMRKEWLAAPLLLIASALVLSLVYLQYNFSGKWLSGPAPISWSGSALTLIKGQGYPGKDKLVIEGLGGEETAVAILSLPGYQAEDFAFVQWTITGMTPDLEVEFLWRTAGNRVFKRPVAWTGNALRPLQLANDKNWRGQIIGLALIVKGKFAAPIAIKGVSLLPARAALPIMFKRWLELDTWGGESINFLDGDAIEQVIAPVPAIAAVILLALAMYWLLARYKIAPLNVAVVGGIVFLGWLALDVRWQGSLLKLTEITRHQFAGKSWEEKHLAADDGALFDFIRHAKAKIPVDAVRVLYFSDDGFLRGRGAYNLFPLNVMARSNLPSAGQFKAGDIIVLYAKKNVKFDHAQQMLMWGDQSLRTELLLLAEGNAVLRVR